MKTIDRYILREIAVPCLLAIGIICFLGIANELRERVELLPLAYVNLWDLIRLSLFFLPTLAVYVIPITYMLGILFAFGGLAQNGEIVAMRAMGIPLKRLVLPAIVAGGALSVASFVVQEQVGPWAALRIQDLIFREMPLRITFENLPTGMVHEFGDWRVYIAEKEPGEGLLRHIEIVKPDSDGRPIVFYAQSARLVKDAGQRRISMRDGYFILPEEHGGLPEVRFPTFDLVLPDLTARNNVRRREMLYLSDLLEEHRKYEERVRRAPTDQDRHELRKIREEVAGRLALPFACLAVGFAAAPLAVRAPRSGKSYGFAIGAGIFLVYFLVRFLAESRSLNPLGEVIFRGELANIVLCLAGIWFLRRVDRV